MIPTLASSITKVASKQTYYTIRLLADRERVEDAYRAYGYFRWVDDVLDSDSRSASERMTFLERQKSLLKNCYRSQPPRDVDMQEDMPVTLVRHDTEKNSGLQTYLRNMLLVMDFDARRRGRLISQAELNEYTHWLAVAVTEAIHYFIGHGEFAARDETRTLAVSGAHIIHLLRDTFEDVQAGYYNIPREVLQANRIGPQDVDSQAYRLWVKSRVELAHAYFEAGKSYIARSQNLRRRLAGIAYISRFEWLLRTIEREGYSLRPEYPERKNLGTGLGMSWLIFLSWINLSGAGSLAHPVAVPPLGKTYPANDR